MKSGLGEQVARIAVKLSDVRADVARVFIKPRTGHKTIDRRTELHPQLDRLASVLVKCFVGCIGRAENRTRARKYLGIRNIHVGGGDRADITRIVKGTRPDRCCALVGGHPGECPAGIAGGALPGGTSIDRDLHACQGVCIRRRAGNDHLRARRNAPRFRRGSDLYSRGLRIGRCGSNSKFILNGFRLHPHIRKTG